MTCRLVIDLSDFQRLEQHLSFVAEIHNRLEPGIVSIDKRVVGSSSPLIWHPYFVVSPTKLIESVQTNANQRYKH